MIAESTAGSMTSKESTRNPDGTTRGDTTRRDVILVLRRECGRSPYE